jgi:hypothetical protein
MYMHIDAYHRRIIACFESIKEYARKDTFFTSQPGQKCTVLYSDLKNKNSYIFESQLNYFLNEAL